MTGSLSSRRGCGSRARPRAPPSGSSARNGSSTRRPRIARGKIGRLQFAILRPGRHDHDGVRAARSVERRRRAGTIGMRDSRRRRRRGRARGAATDRGAGSAPATANSSSSACSPCRQGRACASSRFRSLGQELPRASAPSTQSLRWRLFATKARTRPASVPYSSEKRMTVARSRSRLPPAMPRPGAR